MVGLIILSVLILFGAFSLVFGVDSRDGFSDPRWPNPVGLS